MGRALPQPVAIMFSAGWSEDRNKAFLEACKIVGQLQAVVRAARAFADDQTCLDKTCGHKVCVLNKALAALPKGAA